MLKFFHHLLNPHCPECAAEREEKKVCNSCDILKLELARLQLERDKLLDRILEKPVTVERTIAPEPSTRILPKALPWAVRRQMLEAEDRERARLMKQAEKDNAPHADVKELERELDIAAETREDQSKER